MSDVYDCKAWKERFGDEWLIVLQFCIDAIPAFKNMGMSLMPGEFLNLSLPPQVRTRPEFMLLSMLMPSSLKAAAQKKYLDFLCIELNMLSTIGLRIPGGEQIKVKVFGSSLDLPGRDKFFQLRGNDLPPPHAH